MKTRLLAIACLTAIVILPASGAITKGRAAPPRDRLIVTVDWLKKNLDDRNLVLLHVGREDDYKREHIPGARFISQSDLAAPMKHDEHGRMPPGTLALELPTPEAARAKLEALGISDESRVVVYYGTDWVSPATRIVLTLDWLGIGDRVSVLDGGMQAWKRAGGAVTDVLPTVTAGRLRPRTTKPVTVDFAWVRAHLNDPRYVIIDARDRVFYDGVQGRRDGSGRPGHIAGASSFPYTETVDETNHFKSAEALTALFEEAGYTKDKTIVAYCHIGQQATAVVFAARTLGYRVVLYDGSYTDWEARADAPVDSPQTTGGTR